MMLFRFLYIEGFWGWWEIKSLISLNHMVSNIKGQRYGLFEDGLVIRAF